MPYLQHLYCEHCGPPHRLDIDHETTLRSYIDEGRKSAYINQPTIIWDYLVYKCMSCGVVFLYTYRDVERRVRVYLSNLSREHAVRLSGIVQQNNEFEARKQDTQALVRKRYGKG